MKKLLVCPNCEKEGKKNVLAEVKDDEVSILRFHKGETIISGKSFFVKCGNCGEIIYLRERRQDVNVHVWKKTLTSRRICGTVSVR